MYIKNSNNLSFFKIQDKIFLHRTMFQFLVAAVEIILICSKPQILALQKKTQKLINHFFQTFFMPFLKGNGIMRFCSHLIPFTMFLNKAVLSTLWQEDIKKSELKVGWGLVCVVKNWDNEIFLSFLQVRFLR